MEDEEIVVGGEYTEITIEQIAALFGSQEVLGCGATQAEYETWYNNLGITTEQPADLTAMFNTYTTICDEEGVYWIPPSADTPKDDRNMRTLALIGGGLLLYGILKK